MIDFPSFFRELWPEQQPFPWQSMLAGRASQGNWPKLIALPTASGKTACLDAAVFGLAATAALNSEQRLPRRIWFVVDRRIVVDEAFERAQKVAAELVGAQSGPLFEVAQVLRGLSGTDCPLAVARLRGGTWSAKNWPRYPSQPTIICSTVDQLGSALLFRAYGHSDETASIYAGLAAHDSLIILDEAHCAIPFMQTLDAIARYREEPWSEQPLKTPFRLSVMSATPPDSIPEAATFPDLSERAAALDHPLLHKRMKARKLAKLEERTKDDDKSFAEKAVNLVKQFKKQGKLRIAVMVNRISTAKEIADRLRPSPDDEPYAVILLTGRMRPLDRDLLVERWEKVLEVNPTKHPENPLVVVTTQCLEVGADFSFDSLVTECASLDALRQRFGRLDRLGELGESSASILIRERDAEPPKGYLDPIYGRAIHETWIWLNEREQRLADCVVDFGIAAMDERVDMLHKSHPQRFNQVLAPWDDAPVLLPAHLDLLCQTSPRPTPEPDVGLFLHGKGRTSAEVRVVFRTDLKGEDEDIDTLSLIPPAGPEMLPVPINRLRAWLLKITAEDQDGDVEGMPENEESGTAQAPTQRFVIWRGRKLSEVTGDLDRLRSNDVVVLPFSKEGIRELGQVIDDPEGLGPEQLDLAEHAFSQARNRAVMRVRKDVLGPLCDRESITSLLDLADSDPTPEDIRVALRDVLDEDEASNQEPEASSARFLPQWLKAIITRLQSDQQMRIEEHPGGGLVLIGKTKFVDLDSGAEDDLFADAEDRTSEAIGPVLLSEHAFSVTETASKLADICVDPPLRDAIVSAAQAHDLGKLDWRFQLLLCNGDWTAVSADKPLAKSAEFPTRTGKRQEIEADGRLPKDFRHEFLSMQLVEHFGLTPPDEKLRELVIHLIASHHGYARPFAPYAPDKLVAQGRTGEMCLNALGISASLSAAERRDMAPSYRIDSGVPDRFWRLTRRYGWWGLAYLEDLCRLSDWEASRNPRDQRNMALEAPRANKQARSAPVHRIPLDALDGANPLAFLAALGALRLLTRVLPQYDLRLSWEERIGAWRPLFSTKEPLDEIQICDALCQNGLDLAAMFSKELLDGTNAASPKNKKGEASWIDRLKFPICSFRASCRSASESSSCSAEYAAAWAGETVEDRDGMALRTRFDFTAGQQAFVGMVRELKKSCRAEDLQATLFTGWRYSAQGTSMRWDTQDEKRQYALQSSDPTKSDNPPIADLGANFLAVEALPLFPLVPNRRGDQAGFDGQGDGRCWSWPIWTYPASLDVTRSLLALPLSDATDWPAGKRREIGISAVFQSRIVMPSGRYRCFTPARNM